MPYQEALISEYSFLHNLTAIFINNPSGTSTINTKAGTLPALLVLGKLRMPTKQLVGMSVSAKTGT